MVASSRGASRAAIANEWRATLLYVRGASRAMRSDRRCGVGVVVGCVCVSVFGTVGFAVGVIVGDGVSVLFLVTRWCMCGAA